jgi:hypothetical protein
VDPVPNGAAPTVTSIDPSDDLVGGGATFTITGTGFQANGAGDTSVMFGSVPAVFQIVSDTSITGTVPVAGEAAPMVTVTNALGSANVPFTYAGIYGAQGRASIAGSLYLIDPRDGTSVEIGPIIDSNQVKHAIGGMEFAPDGTLYATEVTYNDADIASLLKIDPLTGVATVVGPLTDNAMTPVNHQHIGDIAFAGTTLLGWTEDGDDPVTIDTSTGGVTVTTSSIGSYGDGFVELADGSMVIMVHGASGSTTTVATADLATADTAVTLSGTVSGGTALCAATRFRGAVYVLGCYEGGRIGTLDPVTGVIAMTNSGVSGIDAIASKEPAMSQQHPAPQLIPTPAPPTCDGGIATIHVRSAMRPSLYASAIPSRGDAFDVSAGRAGKRGIAVSSALGSIDGTSTVELSACGGASLRIAAADAGTYVLVPNQRGQLKLLDPTGRVALRNVTSVRAF